MRITAETIAWLATIGAVYFSAKCANAFLKSQPRLFGALALLALAWAFLLPYYSTKLDSELLPAYNGFLMVYIGGLLALEAKARQIDHTSVAMFQSAALWLFLLIAVPSAVVVAGPGGQS